MIELAKKYVEAGLSVVGCRNKRPVQSWNDFKDRMPTDQEIKRMFTSLDAKQIAIVCGAISGNLEVIDVDVKSDDAIRKKITKDISRYFDGKPQDYLVCAETWSGGLHFYYRCEIIEGNQKLAKKESKEVILETRGEGGYVIAPPSEGYSFLFGSYDSIKVISLDQRDDLLAMCRSYNEYEYRSRVQDKPKKITSHEYSETPWDEYNADTNEPWISVLSSHGWEEVKSLETDSRIFFKRPGTTATQSANWHKSKRLFYVWSSSTAFEPEKAYSPAAIYAMLECDGDFNKAAIRFKDMGYGKHFTKSEEGIIHKAKELINTGLDQDLIKDFISYDFDRAGIKNDEDKKKLIKTADYQAKCENGLFWSKKQRGGISIDLIDFAEYLSRCGFYRLYDKQYSTSFEIIHLDHEKRIAYYTNPPLIKDELDKILQQYNWVDFNITFAAARELIADIGKDKWDRIFDKLSKKYNENITFLRDEENKAFFPFKNGVVEVTADTISFMDYSSLPENCYIWYDQIIQREVNTKGIDYEIQRCDSDFYKFVKRLAGVNKVHKDSLNPKMVDKIKHAYSIISESNKIPNFFSHIDDDDFLMYLDIGILKREDKTLYDRLAAFFSSIGYLLTNYKDPSRAFCITIGEDIADEGQGGGTGKSLLMEGIRKMRNVEKEDGKNWKMDSNFAFQKIRYGLDVLYIEDVKSKFNFELIYNLITNDTSIEKKNKDAFNMSFKESPKIAISTNYDINSEGDHSDRRNKMILVNRYFHAKFQPTDEYPKRFFDQWDDGDWNDFYNSMFFFVQFYLKFGIQDFKETIPQKVKSVKLKYKESFFEYIYYFFKDYDGKETLFAELYENFLEEYDEKKYWSSTRFAIALKDFCNKFDIQFEKDRMRIPSMLGGHDTKRHQSYTFTNYVKIDLLDDYL